MLKLIGAAAYEPGSAAHTGVSSLVPCSDTCNEMSVAKRNGPLVP